MTPFSELCFKHFGAYCIIGTMSEALAAGTVLRGPTTAFLNFCRIEKGLSANSLSAYSADLQRFNEFFQEWDLARDSVREAAALIGEGESDHLLDEIVALKTRIMRASGINDTLRGWSEGIIAGKTFQQVTEEFAEIVIPKVWQREGRKISRVAESLSVSPKKVRRILRRVGVLKNTD